MADNIEIQIGNDIVKLPRWATEETAKQMAKYNAASAKALTELLKNTQKNNKTVIQNQKLFSTLKTATTQDKTEMVASTKKLKKAQSEYGDILKRTTSGIKKAASDFIDAINKNSFSSVVAIIGGIIGLGTTAKFAAEYLEKFSENISHLTNVGIGFGVTMTELRNQAALTGTSLENYTNLVIGNSDALRAIGENAQDGARRFSILSENARRLAREFNNYGLSNQEFNELLLQEIELRRRSGATQQEITNGLSKSFKELMVETTAMATLTGQDRREMLRRRQEMLTTPAVEAARIAAMREGKDISNNLSVVTDAFGAGGDVGSKIGQAMITAILQNRDFRAVGGGFVAELQALDPDVAEKLTEIQEFVRANIDSLDTTENRAKLVAMLSEIPKSVSDEDLKRLSLLADTGNEAAGDLISFIAEIHGIENTARENAKVLRQAAEQMQSTALIGLTSAYEEFVTNLQSSALESVLSFFRNFFGIEVDETGQSLVEGLHTLSDNFGVSKGLFEGLNETILDVASSMSDFEKALKGATIALVALSLSSGGRSLLGSVGKGLYGLGSAGVGFFGAKYGKSLLGQLVKNKMTGALANSKNILNVGKGMLGRGMLGLLKVLKTGGPIGLGIGAGLAPSRLGDGTLDGAWQQENPYPENGSAKEQAEWERKRKEFINSQTKLLTQTEVNREFENAIKEKIPVFEDLSPFEKNRMRLETPGTSGQLAIMKDSGLIDHETYAILTGRPIPGKRNPYVQTQKIDRMDELIETNKNITQSIQRLINWLQQNN